MERLCVDLLRRPWPNSDAKQQWRSGESRQRTLLCDLAKCDANHHFGDRGRDATRPVARVVANAARWRWGWRCTCFIRANYGRRPWADSFLTLICAGSCDAAMNVRLRWWWSAPIWLALTIGPRPASRLDRLERCTRIPKLARLSQHATGCIRFTGWLSSQRTNDFSNMPWGQRGLAAPRQQLPRHLQDARVGLYGFQCRGPGCSSIRWQSRGGPCLPNRPVR